MHNPPKREGVNDYRLASPRRVQGDLRSGNFGLPVLGCSRHLTSLSGRVSKNRVCDKLAGVCGRALIWPSSRRSLEYRPVARRDSLSSSMAGIVMQVANKFPRWVDCATCKQKAAVVAWLPSNGFLDQAAAGDADAKEVQCRVECPGGGVLEQRVGYSVRSAA